MMLHSLLATIFISLGMGGCLVLLRRILRLRKTLTANLGLTSLGGGTLVMLHLISQDLFGLDPWYGTEFEVAKHGLELLVILMLLVAF
ncbi:hypothetical protein [Fuscovulum ytuae]|uniref:NADH dehydrogenase subunit 4L n=1 Tax=Fuscovulum ytuae TaxID=3042299 RepID=A0ABY8Q7P8_9RHOB|nr:hypothetical protein [Fuscovulum sp. YMD61]WGV16668.1 hypothetical protein QF092_02295 [Fuscovulum sp. YMD61]